MTDEDRNPKPADWHSDLLWPARYAICPGYTRSRWLPNLYAFAPGLCPDADGLYESEQRAFAAMEYLLDRRDISKADGWRIVLVRWSDLYAHRFRTSLWKNPVWHRQYFWRNAESEWVSHYLHSVPGEKEFLYYYESDAKRQLDRPTAIRPGRYLRRLFPSLSDRQIAFYANWQITGSAGMNYEDETTFPLEYATTPADITKVYRGGIRSCMSQSATHYGLSVHPASVYGAGDLAIAYLRDTLASSFKIIARCLVWPSKKAAGRLYPNVDYWEADGFTCSDDAAAAQWALYSRLVAADYKFVSENRSIFNGARVLRIAAERGYVVMPFLDGGLRFGIKKEDNKHFYLSNRGHFAAEDTSGKSFIGEKEQQVSWEQCPKCSESVSTSELVPVRIALAETQTWCPGCISQHAFLCYGTNHYHCSDSFDSVRVMPSGRPVATYWASLHCWQSAFSGAWFVNGSVQMVNVTMEDGSIQTWTSREFSVHGFTCKATGVLRSKNFLSKDFPGCGKDVTAEQYEKICAQKSPRSTPAKQKEKILRDDNNE